MKKRLLSLLLAILMVVTSVPMFTLFAFAEEEKVPYDYDSLYVGAEEGGSLFFAVDFFSAKSGDAFTSTSYANTYSKFVTKSEDSSITISGGNKKQASAWKVAFNTTKTDPVAPNLFLTTGFGKTTFNTSFLIYANADAAAGVENAIIYDASNEDKFHTQAMATIGASYDFDNFDYYLLDDNLFVYAVSKTNTKERYIYGFSTDYVCDTSGYKRSLTYFGDGYIVLGQATALSTNVNKLIQKSSVNKDGDYTIEAVIVADSANKTSHNVTKMFNDYVTQIQVGQFVNTSMNDFYIYNYLGGTLYKTINGPINTFDALDANTYTSVLDMTNYTGDDTTYSGSLNLDVFVNGKLIVPGVTNAEWNARALDSVYDKDGNRLHTLEKDISVAINSSNMTIGNNYEWGNNTLYAFRVYNKALTPEEMSQNHFADLAKFYQIDMLGYDGLSSAKKAEIHEALSDFLLTKTTDTETAAAVQAAYTAAYLEASKTGNEAYDAFTARVISEGFDVSAFSSLTKTQKENVINALSGNPEFTQDDLEKAIANSTARVNTTTEDQYNSLYVQDGALLLSDFYSAKAGNYLTKGGSSNTKITYNGYYGYYEEDGSGNKVVKWKEVNTETISSATLYSGHSSNYTNYIHKTTKFKDATGADKTLALSGGSVHIPDEDIIITKLSSKKDNNVKPGEYVESYTAGNYDYYLYESTDALGNTSLYTLRVPKGSDLSAERTYEQYIVTTGALSNTYFQTSGYYSYESEFRDGYFSLGYVTGLSISNFSEFMKAGGVKSAESNGEEHLKYTLQVITALDTERWPSAGGSGAFMLSTTRANYSARLSNGQYKLQLGSISLQKSKAATTLLKGVYFDTLASEPNEFTLGYDATFTDFSTNSSSGLTKGYMNFDMFLNGKLVDMRGGTNYTSAAYYDDSEADTSNTLGINIENTAGTIDTNFKLGENAALNIYAIRVYSKTLTLDEIRQNHFADLVKYNKVDVSNIFELEDSQKQEIYDIFADIKLTDKTTDELQAMYDEKFDDLYWSNFYEDGNDSHNHVIDLAQYYSLDLAVYNALTAKAKEELYKATDAQELDDSIFNADMQNRFNKWIDEAVESLLAGDGGNEKLDPYSLYVQDGLIYHVNFLKAGKNGEPLYTEGTYADSVAVAKHQRAAMLQYAVGDVLSSYDNNYTYNNFIGESQDGNSKVISSNENPLVFDNYLQLYGKKEDGTFEYYPIQYGGESKYLSVNDMTMQFVTSYEESVSKNFSWWLCDFRFSLTLDNGILSYAKATHITRWGRANAKNYAMAHYPSDPEANSTSYINVKSEGYNTKNALTYTLTADRTINDSTTNYVYDISKYPESEKNSFTQGFLKDSDYIIDAGETKDNKITVVTLPELTDEQKAEIEAAGKMETDESGNPVYVRTEPEHFDGATVVGGGITDAKFYVGDSLTGVINPQYFSGTATSDTPVGRSAQNALFKMHAIRVYQKTLTVEEIRQNNFADLAVMFDIELDIFALLSDDDKQTVYEEMMPYTVTHEKSTVINAYNNVIEELYYTSESEEPTENELHFYEVASYYRLNLNEYKKLSRVVQLAICDQFVDVIASENVSASIIALRLQDAILMQSDENFANFVISSIVSFEGYAVRKSYYPGIRSIYTIDKTLVETLESEERGYTVTIGAMMGLANVGETVRTSDDLAMKKVDGEYVIDTANAAFVEVYNSAREDADENGFVASYWQEKEGVYHMAFTTTYEKADSQTVDMYNTELIYGAYVILEKEGEEDKIFYVDTDSEFFGETASLYEVSSVSKELRGDAYSMVQKVLNETDGTDFLYGMIAGVELPDFTFVYDKADEVFATELISELNTVIKGKLGVELKTATTDAYTGKNAIYIVEREDLEDANYGVYVDGGNLYITYDYAANAKYAMDIAHALFGCEGNIIVDADYNEMGSVPTYKVVMLGASNVAVSDVFQAVDVYLQTQYGDVSIELLNAGRAGGTISSALNTYNGMYDSRVQREVYAQNPDAVILQFIFNALGSAGINTNTSDCTIERIWNGSLNKSGEPTSGAEVDVDTLFVDGEFIGIDEMKEMYPEAFTAEGRVKTTKIKYDTREEFDVAFEDVEKTAIVKYTVDKSFPLDLTDKNKNLTNYTKFIYDLEALIADFTARGIDVILPTPVDYDEQLVNATGTSERIIGLKYVWADVDNYMKTVLANREGVAVVDYYYAQLELKGQLQENGADGSLMKSDRKHYKGMEGPYAVATAFMTDLIGKSLVLNDSTSKSDTLITDYVAKVAISANGTVNANNATVTDFAVLDNGVTFSYKPHGVSMAQIETLMQVREDLGEAKYYDTAKYAENPNKEIIKIEGLKADSKYSITIGDSTLTATYTGAELAEGVDISLDKNNPSVLVMTKIVDQLYTKRTYLAKLRNMSYIRETELFKAGVDDSVATKEQIFAVLDEIIATKPAGNYAVTTAKQYKENYDLQDSFYSNVNLCDYKVKGLLDFDAYTVTVKAID